ncbi:Receptor-like protein kinase FERONIA [Morella rubra]|uniref:Receptor-like protein kinase FERONIA n=1 Tax=Morella rubra TaxID=262757 RepID=A0A6A1VEZ9_9ROSI|nr:Receptor-like protein kinase FERONIA [Morella rubra]
MAMLLIALHLCTTFHLLVSLPITAKTPPPYTPTDYFLLNCGLSSNSTSPDGRHWEGDSNSKFSPHNIHTTSSTYEASRQDSSISEVPYMTALVVKEFIVNVLNSHHLNVTFIPFSSSYAFINGIEIVSMPNNLYLRDQDSDESAATFVNFQPLVCSVNTTALETMYRLNVGGQAIPGVEDTGMFRTWKNDEDYIYGRALGTTPHPLNVTIKYSRDTPVYTAPKLVYSTSRTMGAYPKINLNYKLTWIFQVDTGFIYLVRLHFCETQLEVTKVNQQVFRIFICNQTAEEAADVIQWSGGSGIPVYKDYLVWVPKKIQGKQDLWLALHPNKDLNPKPEFADAILNGVEIFKLNQSEGNLAGPNPELVVGPTSGFPEEETENKNQVNFPRLCSLLEP